MYDAAAFSEEVIRRWGASFPGLEHDAGLLHCQMFGLAVAIRESFSNDRADLRDAILGFIEHLLERNDADPEIENAVAISFLELAEAQSLGLSLPPRVKLVLVDQQARYARAT